MSIIPDLELISFDLDSWKVSLEKKKASFDVSDFSMTFRTDENR